jgi:glycosyltransferase involved in cell wall biosynthesis
LIARVSPFDLTPLYISKWLNIPLIAEWNTPFFYEIGVLRNGSLISLVKNWEHFFLRAAAMVYSVSEKLKDMLIDQYNLPPSNIVAIPNGYEPEYYPGNQRTLHCQYDKVRSEFGWKDKTVIAFIGSLKTWHGIQTLIEIAECLSAIDKSIHFLVIGDGEENEAIKKANERLDNLTWTGFLPSTRMAYCLTGCDIGIMPYQKLEYFYFSPLKFFDMIGAALPSIGHKSGQISEIMEKSPETGWGIKNGTVDEYVEQIRYLHHHKSEITFKKNKLISSRFFHSWKMRSDELIKQMVSISRRYYEHRKKR